MVLIQNQTRGTVEYKRGPSRKLTQLHPNESQRKDQSVALGNIVSSASGAGETGYPLAGECSYIFTFHLTHKSTQYQ